MANNRIQFATAQLAIKDNRCDPTDDILGVKPDGTLASGIVPADGEIGFNEALSGVWPEPGMFKIKVGSSLEFIRYTSFGPVTSGTGALSEVQGITRGAGGGTITAVVPSGEVAQLCGWEVPLGVQTVSIGTTFNIEDKFTLGQLDPYQVVEGIPEIEITVEKCLDGTKPLWLMATDPDFTSLKGRTSEFKADLALNVYPDTQDSAIGTPDSTVVVSGAFISAWSITMPTDAPFIESVTLVSNDKTWGGQEGTPSGYFPTSDFYDAAVIGSGQQRSEDFQRALSTLPADVPTDDHIQSIDVSADITREDIFELGRKTAFFRAVTFPVTITTTFETITSAGDLVDAIGDGRDNLVNRTIILKTSGGLTINLGAKNKLASVTFEGFDAGGGNGTVTFEYTNSNSLTITHDAFPDAFSNNQDLPNAPIF